MPRTSEQILDELLVLQSQDGDRVALEALLRRWLGPLRERATALCMQDDGAGEVLQASLIAIAGGIGRLEDPGSFPGWAMRIVAHKAADWVRSRRRERGRIGPLSRAEAARESAGPASPAFDAEGPQAAALALVRRALDQLADDRRALLMLHYWRGVPVAGLAAVLGVPVGTIKSRLFKARRELKQLLERDRP